MSNRRTFFATAASALAWLMGVRLEKPAPTITAESIQKMWQRPYKKPEQQTDEHGGFLVPAELTSAITSIVALRGGDYVTFKPATMEEVCKARGVPYIPEITDEMRAKHNAILKRAIAAMHVKKRSKPCES